MSCSKKRKSECIDNCYWIKGKGCSKKLFTTPKWEGSVRELYEPEHTEIPLKRTKEDISESIHIKNFGLDWIYRKYTTSKFKVCIVWDPKSRKTLERFQWVDFTKLPKNFETTSTSETRMIEKFGRNMSLYIPEDTKKMLENCLMDMADIIIIPLHFEAYVPGNERFSKHANIVIINKFLRTIEFYDSNGWEYHINRFGNKDVPNLKEFFKSFPELKRYRIVPYKSFPEHGFQHFESKESKNLGERGKCMFWSIFIAELRIKYYRMDPVELMEKIMGQISDQHKSKEYNEFIKGYIAYIKKSEVRLKEKIQLTELLTPAARGAFRGIKHGTPIWYISRRDDFNTFSVLAEKYLEEKYKKSKNACIVYNPDDASDITTWLDFSRLKGEEYKNFKEEEPYLLEKLRGQSMGLYMSNVLWDVLNKCVDSQVIIWPISCRVTKKERTAWEYHRHRIVVIINNITKSIEMYDPNGGKAHKEMFDNSDVPYITAMLKSIPRFKNYYIFDYNSTFYRGFQSYQAEAKAGTKTHHLERGVCGMWATYIADIRIKYSHLNVYEFTTQILDAIEPDSRPKFFKALIEDYISFLEKKLTRS